MSRTIDQQVVEMQFDNQHFERNVSKSMSTLDKLKQSLNLTGASKGLENINAAAKNNNFGVLGNSVESVKTKFSAMQVVGVTALANITNSAVNAGKRIVKALTIDPVTAGFNEYELKMNSVQTIMASTGESLETVNKYLNELNEYSDKTIYSFSDMTQNIGKFTNAGVKLEDAVLAIKGISNEAAVSGANANEASRAMYNFAQALSAGYVKLIDWKSIENANMATVEFKNELIKTAVECGTLKKQANGMYKVLAKNNMGSTMDQTISATKNFNESLNYQWMTTDVLVKTLGRYADETTAIGAKASKAATEVKTFSQMMDSLKESAQSGWARTWEIIFGNFYEAKDLWTDVNNTVGGLLDKISDSRNAFLESALGSSWEDLTLKIEEAGLSAGDFSKELRKTLKNAGEPVEDLEKEYGDLSNAVKAGKVSAENIRKTLNKVINTEEKVTKSTGKVTLSVKELKKISDQVMNGDFGNGAERMKALSKAGYDYATIQNNVNKILGSSVRHTFELTKTQKEQLVSLTNLTDKQLKSKGYTNEQVAALRELEKAAKDTGGSVNDLITDLEKPSGRMLLLEGLKNLWAELQKILDTVKEAWANVFGEDISVNAGQGLYNLIEDFRDFTEALNVNEGALNSFKAVLEGIFNVSSISFKILGKSVMGALTLLNAIFGVFGTDLLKVAEKIADKINIFAKWLNNENLFGYSHVKNLAKLFEALYNGIKKVVTSFFNLEKLQPIIENIRSMLRSVIGADTLKGISDAIGTSGIVKTVEGLFTKVDTWVKGIDNAGDITAYILKGLTNAFKWALDGILNPVEKIGDCIITVFSKLTGIKVEDMVNILETWHNFIGFIRKGITLIITFATGISNFAKAFYELEPVQQILATLKTNLTNAWSTLQKLFGGTGELSIESFGKKMNSIFTALMNWVEGVKDLDPSQLGTEIISGLTKGLTKGIKSVVDIIVNLATTLIQTFKDILGIESPSRVMIALGGFIIAGLLAGLTSNSGEVGSFISNLGTNIIQWFGNMFNSIVSFAQNIDFGKILAIAFAGSIIYVTKRLADVLEMFGSPLKSITDMCKNITGAVKGVADAVKDAVKLRSRTKAIKEMAIAIAILAGALWVVSKIPWQNLVTGTVALGVLAGIMFVLAKACEKFNGAGEFGLKSASIAAIAFSLLALAVTFKLIASIKPEQFVTATIGFAGVCIALVSVMKALSEITKNAKDVNFKGLAGIFTKFAFALLIMVGAIKLMSMLKLGEVIEGAAYIALVGVLFRLFINSFRGMDANAINQAGWMALKMSTALLLMMGVIKIASMMSLTEVLKGSLVIGAIGVLLAGFILLSNLIGMADAKRVVGIQNAGNLLLKFSVGLLIIAGAIRIIASVSLFDLQKAVSVIYQIGGVCAVLIGISALSGQHAHKAGLMLVEFAFTLLIMSAVILLLKEIVKDSTGLSKAMTVIGYIGLIFAGLIATASLLKEADKVKGVLIALTVAIGVLVLAIVALSFIEDTKSLAIAAGVIGTVLGMFALLIFSLSNMAKSGLGLGKALGVIVLVSALTFALSYMVKDLAKLEPANAIASAKSIGALLLALSASLWILGNTKSLTLKDMKDSLVTLGIMSVFVIMFAGLISELKGVDPVSAVGTAIGVGILLNALAAALWIISNSQPLKPNQVAKIGMVMAMLGIAVLAFTAVIEYLNKCNPVTAIGNAIAMGTLLIALSGAFWIITKGDTIDKRNMPKVIATLGLLTFAIVAIAASINALKDVKPTVAIGSAIAIGVLLLALAASFSVIGMGSKGLSRANLTNIAGTLGVLALILPILGSVIATLANNAPNDAINSAEALGLLINALAIAMIPLSYVGKFGNDALKGALALTSMAMPLAVFAAVVGEINPISGEVISTVKVLAQVMAAMAILMSPLAILAKFTSTGNIIEGVLGLSAMAAPLFIFGQTINTLPNIGDKSASIKILTKVMAAMALLLVPLTALGALMAAFPMIAGIGVVAGIGALTAMVIPMVAFSQELGKLPNISAKMSSIDTLTRVMEQMTNLMLRVAEKPISSAAAIFVIDSLIDVVKNFGRLAITLGEFMNNKDKVSDFLTTGLDLMNRLAHGIGEMIGNLATGVGDVVFDALPGYGIKLNEFAIYASRFITSMQGLGADNTIVTGAQNLASAIGSLLGAASDDFWSFGSMKSLGEQLVGFMSDDVKTFFEDVKNIDAGAITGAKNIADTVKALSEAAKTDAWTNILSFGNNDWSNFGTQLASFGTAMVEFDNAIDGHEFNKASIDAAKTAAETMLVLQGALSPINSVAEFFVGKKDLGDFGTQLQLFGEGVKAFSVSVSKKDGTSALNKDAIQAAKDAGDLMATLQNSIDPVDGVLQWLTGTTGLDTFGDDLKLFGEGVAGLSNALKNNGAGIDHEAIEAAKNTGDLLAQLQAAIPEDKLFDGKISLDDFGTKIISFGASIAQYSNNLSGVETGTVNASVGWAQRLVEVAKSAVEIDVDKIGNFEKIENIGSTIKAYYDSVSGVAQDVLTKSITNAKGIVRLVNSLVNMDSSGVDTFKSTVNKLADVDFNGLSASYSKSLPKLTNMGSGMMDALISGMKNKQTSIAGAVKTIVNAIVTAFVSKATDFSKAGNAYVNNLIKGLNKKKSAVQKASESIGKSAAGEKGAKLAYSSFESAGKYVVDGFASGIKLKAYVAVNAAEEMAKAAAQAAKDALKINSPSKIFMGLGSGVVEGFVKGIYDNTRDVVNASEGIADTARSGFSNAIGRVTDYLNGNMDAQPTIRPVLDLSDVESGAARIGSMFGNPSMGVMGNLGAVSTIMNRRNQNGANDDVVSAINRLGSLMGTNAGNTYQIGGITYNDDTPIADAVGALIRAITVEGRV